MNRSMIAGLILVAALQAPHAFGQNSDAGAFSRLSKLMQNTKAFKKCSVEATPGTIKFGEGIYSQTEANLLEVKIEIPETENRRKRTYNIAIANANAQLFRRTIYNSETKHYDEGVLVEVIDANVLDSEFILAPNRFLLEYRGDGKIVSLQYRRATAYLDGKGPSYGSNLLDDCF